MVKKGQLSIFLIVGMLILLFFSIFLYTKGKRAEEMLGSNRNELAIEVQQVSQYINQCLYNSMAKGIYLIGLQGGYIDPDYNEFYGDFDQVPSEKSGSAKIPYWYHNGRDISPSIEQVEIKLARYIFRDIENCTKLENLPTLTGIAYILPQIAFEDLLADNEIITSSINDKDVSIKFYYPITLVSDDIQATINSFNADIGISLGRDHALAKEIMKRAIGNRELDISSLCRDVSGLVNIFPFNGRILIIDYEPYFLSNKEQSFRFQYLYTDLIIYGYCSG